MASAKPKATPPTPQTSSTSPLVLCASAVIDYDYIMGLIARFSARALGKATMSREELIGTLKAGEGLSDAAIAVR
jgi:type I restriction enzyme R subunit